MVPARKNPLKSGGRPGIGEGGGLSIQEIIPSQKHLEGELLDVYGQTL